MKKFFVRVLAVIGLLLFGMTLAAISPAYGMAFGAIALAISIFALIQPIPWLFLTSRIFSAIIAIFVGALTLLASLGMSSDASRLAELRESTPEEYLAEIKSRNETLWLSELKELDPEKYEIEVALFKEAEEQRALEEQRQAAELEEQQRQLEAERTAALEEQRAAEKAAKVEAYVSQLEREIASIPNVQVSNYTSDVSSINLGLVLIGTWSLLYEQGGDLELSDDEQAKRQDFRQLVVRKQSQMLPALRDAYGPAMRQQLWEADGSARTIGAGYRTVEFVSAAFARNANIKQIHLEIVENLMMLRFTRAQYKWIRQASEFSYYSLEVPRDSDLVVWETAGRYRILN